MKQVFVDIVTIQGFSFAFAMGNTGNIIASSFDPEVLKRSMEEMGYLLRKGTEGEKDIRNLLEKYSRGERVELEKVPVEMQGTDFQKRVWEETRKIPYGRTTTYGELARRIKSSPRAVGMALSRNRIPLFIPCHRVVGKENVGGFTPDVRIKRALLKLEGGEI